MDDDFDYHAWHAGDPADWGDGSAVFRIFHIWDIFTPMTKKKTLMTQPVQ